MSVFWTIRAKRHLRQALAESLCRENEAQGERPHHPSKVTADRKDPSQPRIGVLELTMDRLNDILAVHFGGASVVVKDQVIGYRRKKDLFVLMVEAFGDQSEKSGPFVVKIGPESTLRREIHGWNCCRPPGLKHDLVFLDLDEGKVLHRDGENWLSLIYGDAQQFLGVTATVTLEEAALECVRSGFPKTLSIELVIGELYERIGHLLYSQAFVDDPARNNYIFDPPKLDESLACWETNPACQAARNLVNTTEQSGAERFLDPVDYLRYIQSYVPSTIAGPDGVQTVRPPSADPTIPELPGLLRPLPVQIIPRMLRGCAHGDLHGRNILVGIVRDQAMWPTVFDYEHMGPGNLVGWDFVKLETELKIRAYFSAFGEGNAADFIRKIQNFEIELNRQTEQCHLDRLWPDAGLSTTPEERLRTILLAIRRMAAQHLGASHGRPNEWLEEYYFLLACYGAFTGRFENLQHRERMGALISAGVAASRLSWPRNLGRPDLDSSMVALLV
jgi:hypothetical protein